MPEGPAVGTVRRSSLRQQIADALRDEVLTGRMTAGRHFTVKEIAELYGVSATPVREALVDLTAQGLLDVEHHRGFQVRRFTDAEFRSMVEARTLVVEGIFRRVAARGMREVDPQELASVRRRAEAAARASRAGELEVLIGYDIRFWRELTALADNAHVAEFLDRLRIQTWAYAVPYLRGRPDLAGLCWSGHVSLVTAIEERDPETARRVVEEFDDHSLTLMRRLTTGR
ncbi:GntR family transcriptional regulator [Actinacidiphila sp. bgisy167]|uniref:GntR family transcriptional regulator n=1 Tax=Actinacidiphila sp. bgisy167 TaxID=3413797 RepID=UPI003D70C9FC